MTCSKSKYRTIGEFPKRYQAILMKLETKRQMVEQLMRFQDMHRIAEKKDPKHFQYTDWTLDIQRISQEFAGMLPFLSDEVMDQYVLYIAVHEWVEEGQRRLSEGDVEGCNKCFAKAKEMECCGDEEECCG